VAETLIAAAASLPKVNDALVIAPAQAVASVIVPGAVNPAIVVIRSAPAAPPLRTTTGFPVRTAVGAKPGLLI
jgi:hypothetical protein